MPTAAWLFTLVTAGRQPILTRPETLAVMRAGLAEALAAGGWTIEGLVILPDHLHCILSEPIAGGTPAPDWRRIKISSAQRLRAVWPQAPDPLWHQGHQARPLAMDDLAGEVARLHADPVRHGLIADAASWPWSTARRGAPTSPTGAFGRRRLGTIVAQNRFPSARARCVLPITGGGAGHAPLLWR